MTNSVWLRCVAVVRIVLTLCLLLNLMDVGDGASMLYPGATATGDPAPGRSPGPPPPPLAVGLTSDSAKHGLVDQHQQLTIIMTADTVDSSPCDLDGDLIVVDAGKAAVNVNFTHNLFQSNELTHDVVYQVIVEKRPGDKNHVQGFSLHSLGDGEPRGVFTNSTGVPNCVKSSVKSQLDESSSSKSNVMYSWTLPLDQPTKSNITFRLRYKVHASSSVFQVNYVFAISLGCQIWLRRDAANISSIDFPRTLECQVYFPGHRRNGDGLVLELTRLNVPCSGGGFLQFSGNGNDSQHYPRRQAVLCGKLEELTHNDRQLYFPDLRNHAPFLRLYGHPVFSLYYHLVDHCYNVTFTARNGSFELRPTGDLQCSFKINLPYGNRVVLKLEIGDKSAATEVAPTPPVYTTSPIVREDNRTLTCLVDGLLTELWDGSTSWTHCARRGDLYRRTEIVSRDNRVLMKVSARGQQQSLGLRFQYYAEPVPSVVQQCSFGWVAVRQFCVTAVDNVRLPWLQAELECNRRGGHLASVRTEQAQSIIDQLLMNSAGYRDPNAYWLGASDKTYEGDFRWTDGLPFSYTNWFPGWSQYDHYNRQPNDDGLSDQDCIEVRRLYHLPTASVRLSTSFMWNDRDCSTPNYFLCERLVADEPVEDGWPPECNRTVTLSAEQQRASVSSPGFPRQYPDNADCETDISAPPGYRIIIDFEELVLEKEPLCSYDYLEIVEMTAGHSENVARRLCGDWSAKLKLLRYVSTGSRLRLRFVSDYSHHYGGFKARMSMENAMQCADDRLVMFNNSCYLFVSYPEVTWPTAQQICKGMRAQLSSVTSPEEERFVTTNIRRTAEYRTSAVYWLGSRMSPEYGTYHWLDGSTMSYTAWLPGQNPIEQKQQQQRGEKYETPPMCLGIQWTSSPTPMLPSGLYWRSKRCSAVGGYVCKRRNQISGSELNFNRTVNGTEGRLTSPNYPGNYYSNLDFLVKIIGPERTRLIIQFSKLDLEPQLECLYDYIELRSVIRGDTLNDAVKWCGNHDTDMERFDFVSETNEAELRFHSDYSISGSGFSVTWHAVDVSACPLQTLTAREGVVTSPNYPHFLLARLDCAITILAPAGKRVWLEITDYDMDGSGWYELGQSRRPMDSNEAVLELDLGGSATTVFRPFQVPGQLTDGAFVSTSERLQVRLRTADRPRGAGFRAVYKTVNGLQEERIIDLVNVTSGTLLHLNYPNPSPMHIDFLQHLIAPLGHVILLELYNMKFSSSEHGCHPNEGSIDVVDNYADSNGTSWHLCYNNGGTDGGDIPAAPLAITSYLNTLHIRQRSGATVGVPLNGSLRVRADVNYKIKLLRQEESVVESCSPNPCQNKGKCITNGGRKFCQCVGHYTGLFCALTMCELEPCVFGQCTLTASSFQCHCQTGYAGATCEQKQRPCEGHPCEGRGECIERGDTFHCRCHAWWEGVRCERRMMHIPYTPLSERMLHEPFWLGLITVTIVLAVIGLVWCARRHFPEKLEKLLAEESDRNRCTGGTSLRGSSVREQLAGGTTAVTAAVMVVPSPQPGCQRSLFGRLGIRKPSILSLTSPHGLNMVNNQHATSAAAARTFSLDDLLKPPPRRTPSPRKKRNNSTPTKKNAAEKKQILQQLISPSNQQRARKVSIGELIQLSERKLKEQQGSSTSGGDLVNDDIKETHLGENNVTSTAQITLTDPKLEKKVTFARLLNKVSQEMSSGSEVELGVLHTSNSNQSSGNSGGQRTVTLRPASTPPSPGAEMRSPNSTSSNQGSDSLSSSDLALDHHHSMLFGRKVCGSGKLQAGRNNNKPAASADSILAMFRNFSSTAVTVNNIPAASIRVSPSTTPTASTPQDDAAGDDESTTSSNHTPISLDSPPPLPAHHRRHSTIEVPVLDALSAAHKCNDFLHPPTILLEVPSTSSNKCLSPIREMPTPLPTPLPSPCLTPVLQRSTASSSAEDLGMDLSDDRISVELPCMSTGYSDDDDDDNDADDGELMQDIAIDIQAEDGLIQEEAACSHAYKYKPRPPLLGQQSATVVTTSTAAAADNVAGGGEGDCHLPPPPLVIPMLTIQQPSPTHTRPHLLTLPGSPPPHRSGGGVQECSNFHNHHHHHHPAMMAARRMLKDFDKPTSLDLPCAPPLITVTCNMSEAESDAESLSPLATKASCNQHLGPTSAAGTVGMCYLSPFSMCSRADRTASESNLSSSGYSSMASPGPSRCGSNNPLCPSEMEDPGPPPGGPTSIHSQQLSRRPSPLTLKSNPSNSCAGGSTVDNNAAGEQRRGGRGGRSDSETLSDDPMLESNDEGIGTDHIDEKIDEGELKSAKELELYIGKDLLQMDNNDTGAKLTVLEDLLFPSASVATASPVCKLSLLQLPSIVIETEPCVSDSVIASTTLTTGSLLSDKQQQQQHVSPVSSRSESPLSDRTIIGGASVGGLGRFSPHFYNKHKDVLPFTDSDGLYDFPSSDCAPQNKVSVVSTMQQHRKSTGRKREKKSARSSVLKSPTKVTLVTPNSTHHHHLDVPSGKESSHYRVQTPRKPSPKRRARKEQIVSSSSSSESLSSIREPKLLSSSSPSPDTVRWPAASVLPGGPIVPLQQHGTTLSSTGTVTVPVASSGKWLDMNTTSRRSTTTVQLVHESSCDEDSTEESFSVLKPSVIDDMTNKQTRKISRLRTISHQIRFLRRLEKSLKRREHLQCPSDSIDSGDGEEYCRVTSPLLQPELGPKPEIRKSISIGLLHSGGGGGAAAASSNTSTTRLKRGKMKKGSDLLIPQEDITWSHVLATGNGHSD